MESTNAPLSVELGPGLIGSIYDGIQRPLNKIMEATNSNLLSRGVEVPALDREKKWQFEACVSAGEEVQAGDIIGTVQETAVVQQKIMIPYGVSGKIKDIASGQYTVEEVLGHVSTEDGDVELKLLQKWPVRLGRPYKEKLPPDMPLVTGQRVIDAFFPILRRVVTLEEAMDSDNARRNMAATVEQVFRLIPDQY